MSVDDSKDGDLGAMREANRLDQIEAINRLTAEVARLNSHRFVKIYNSRWRMIGFSLSRGLAFGLGSVLGGGILVSLLGWWLSQFEFLPYFGEWAAQLVKEIQGAE